jgi:hypothetical protein
MDETWVNQNHCTDYMWLPNDRSDAPKIPSGKGTASYINNNFRRWSIFSIFIGFTNVVQ